MVNGVVTHETVIGAAMPDGSTYPVKRLLSTRNVKFTKSGGRGVRIVGLTMAPYTESGYNVCAMASAGCKAGCLKTAGHNTFRAVRWAQIAKTRAFFQHKATFLEKLVAEIEREERSAARAGLLLAVRLNTMSDLQWERIFPELFSRFPDVQFYDYTKVPGRVTPANYHLTFSRSEENETTALAEFARGLNVAVVFATKNLPATWHGIPVFSGDETDLRFLDGRGIVGLYAKGKAKLDQSGFVVRSAA